MSTFDLSLAVPKKENEVQASTEYQKETNPQTGDVRDRKVTDSGLTVDKDKAPKLQLAGPLGHMYTELLNEQLSLESMGGVVAAAAMAPGGGLNQTEVTPETGKLRVGPQGAAYEHGGNDGYIFITKSSDLGYDSFKGISADLLARKAKDPEAKLGVAVINDGTLTESLESLTRVMKGCGIPVVYTEEGLTSMAKSMFTGA